MQRAAADASALQQPDARGGWTQGWLLKRSGGWTTERSRGLGLRKRLELRHWQRRWFTLGSEETVLRYYKSREEASSGAPPAGSLDCAGAHVARADHKGQAKDAAGFGLCVHATQRVLSLQPGTAVSRDAWESALQLAAARIRSLA